MLQLHQGPVACMELLPEWRGTALLQKLALGICIGDLLSGLAINSIQHLFPLYLSQVSGLIV